MAARLVNLTRGQAIVDIDGVLFNVNGEGSADGTWQAFPLMVYQQAGDDRWRLIQDGQQRADVVAALRTCWPDNVVGWSRLVIPDHDQFETPLILSVDIVQRVVRDFPDPDDASIAGALLQRLDCPEAERVARCILHMSGGSLTALRNYAELALKDYRDAIFFAEYDRYDNRLHDFSKPFT